jgi:ribosome biogenesis GTPase
LAPELRGDAAPLEATVVAAFGRTCLVRTGAGALVPARARHRAIAAVAGDRVRLHGEVVRELVPRSSRLERSSAHRRKVIAANVTQILIVAACEPAFSDELICRILVAAARCAIRARIVLNKVDLAAGRDAARARLAPFRLAGVPVAEVSAHHDVGPLGAALAGERSVLVGQSGMGKSTLLKALVPEAEVRIREISAFLAGGRHATTASRLYRVAGTAELIDTPGLTQYGLHGCTPAELCAGFPELAALAGNCRFRDCRHLAEPGCAVRAAAEAGRVSARRLELYRRILASP